MVYNIRNGGGTGTGASHVIAARAARELNILNSWSNYFTFFL